MIEPHGGQLVDRRAGGERAEELRSRVDGGPIINLSEPQYQDLWNVAFGRYSPLTGFLTQNDFLKVVNDLMLEDGTVWPLPVILDIDAETASALPVSEQVGLQSPSGKLIGVLEVADVYRYNEHKTARQVFGSTDGDHPGVARLFDREEFLVGGDVTVFGEPRSHIPALTPAETRVLFRHNSWNRVAGFQTRNAPHRAHEYLQKTALEGVDGLLIHPKVGEKKAGDYTDDALLGAYQSLIDAYFPESIVALSTFPCQMRYAGPREAVFDALVRKNHGCTHFVVGRDHAGVGEHYGEFAAQEIFDKIGDVGIKPLFYQHAFYCGECDGMASTKTCPHDDTDRIHPSGSEIRATLRRGKRPPETMMRSDVADYLMQREDIFVDEQIGVET
ncbi:sulfate adenylyltransferase [Haloarcula montana]|uniref:sulfate adenylyltransferase n=1 Tax=Haloarcula montana TaxID=3111776 RepID=UPI002D79829C|nr:sulfate adenylyltransferase [Haloarcula sp. GH36]